MQVREVVRVLALVTPTAVDVVDLKRPLVGKPAVHADATHVLEGLGAQTSTSCPLSSEQILFAALPVKGLTHER